MAVVPARVLEADLDFSGMDVDVDLFRRHGKVEKGDGFAVADINEGAGN